MSDDQTDQCGHARCMYCGRDMGPVPGITPGHVTSRLCDSDECRRHFEADYHCKLEDIENAV